jgi:bifunctional non-homologous end joining protein LigD
MRTGSAAGVRGKFPGFIKPSLASSIGKPPSGDQWIHEIKFDGYRVQLHINRDNITIYTRNGYDWTTKFSKIAADAWRINARTAVIDGEVIAPGTDGVSDFAVLQKALRSSRPSQALVMYAFDLLYLNGTDLRKLPLVDRKATLSNLIAETPILMSESFEEIGSRLYQHACELGLEGIVSKRKHSRYHSDRTNDWVKVTCRQRETLPVTGFSLKENRFDGLFLGRLEGGQLRYAGKVDHGFTPDDIIYVRKRLQPLVQKVQPYSERIRKPNATWVKPELLAEVEYRAKSAAGKVRHPFFKGFREDLR